MTHRLQHWLGGQLGTVFGQDERIRQVRVATAIGVTVGLLFAIFNILTEGMLALGLIELGAVVLLVVPALALSRLPRWIHWSESLLLLAAMVIFGALIVLGGVEGTGLFWVYTAPFLAFFLKGQRLGWRYCLAFFALAIVHLQWLRPKLPFAYPYSPTVSDHFLLSLGFYTLVAAAFNYVRSRNEAQLRQTRDAADQAFRQLQLAKETTEAAYAAKSRFLAAASHDLRQPAHALGLFVAQLSQTRQGPASAELVAGLNASVRALQEMLDVFFDYSRLDALSTAVNVRAIPMERIFEQLRVCFVNLAAQKGLRLRVRASPAWVRSDPILLQRVLLNLVSNAVRYTPRGSILVSCRPAQGNRHARIEVRDSGIGIAPEHHERIFEEFFQVRNQERDRAQGLGLGLSMVQRSCQLLQHPLTLRSNLACGSCFTLTVPLAPPPAPPQPCQGAELRSTSDDLDGLHVLLIEDDKLGSTALKGLLASWGCRVTVASDALMACDQYPPGTAPDFIVSDYRLPGQHNGVEAVQLLRAASRQDIAACLISGDTGDSVRQQAASAALVLLQKPVQPAKLRTLLRRTATLQPAPARATLSRGKPARQCPGSAAVAPDRTHR